MTLARRHATSLVVLLLLAALIGVPAGALAADRAAPGGAGAWIVAVARGDGSAIGGRASALSPLPRAREGRGDPAARREVRRILRTNGIRPTVVYRHAFDGFAARLSAVQLAALRRDRSVVALLPDVATRVDAGTVTTAGGSVIHTRLKKPVLPTGIRRINADRGPLSRIDGIDDPLDVDVAIIDTGIAPSPDLRIAGGYDCSSDDPDAWRDREGHGTHVAGTVAARDDRQGVVGVAPGARLWAIKIFDDGGNGRLSTMLCGFDHVLGMRDPGDSGRPRIEVINLSIGYWLNGFDDRDCGRPSGDVLHGAICALVADGTTVVAAAGNQSVSTTTRMPAAYDEAITVSALADFDGLPGGVGRQDDVCPWYSRDGDDTFGNFSNFGPDVDLIAPGKCILSTLPDGWYAWSTGTSMATPHVAGAAALLAAAHPGARPSQIKSALLGGATLDWKTKTDPDGRPDPLLDVANLGPLPDLSVSVADASDELAHGGLTRIDVTIDRQGAERGPIEVRATDLPDGITAEIAPTPTKGSAVTIWLHADGSAAAGDASFTVRATDGDLVRTADAAFRVRSGGPTIAFSAPDGGADGLRITDGDGAVVAFTETDPGAAPVERRVLRQAGMPVRAGTCDGADWSGVGDPVTPSELDPSGSVEAGWSFAADLGADGCTRWLVRLIDADGGSARFASPAVLRDTTAPRRPTVAASGEGVARDGTTVWVRGGTGTVTLTATGADDASGVASHAWGELADATGWTVEPGPGATGSTITLRWNGNAVDTAIDVRATDTTGRTGPARTVVLRVDGSRPRPAGWYDPPSGTDRVIGWGVELGWRRLEDVGSGIAKLQRVQRQTATARKGSCGRVTWTDDGPARLVAPHEEQWDLRSGRCYRWILVPLDLVGNTGRASVSGSVFADLLGPKADFLAPDEGRVTVIARTRYRVSWTERAQVGGGASFRSLEQERVKAVGDACPTLGWVQHGPVDRGASPSRVTGLQPGYCYRWRLNLSDSRDNLSTELSGVVRVTAPAP